MIGYLAGPIAHDDNCQEWRDKIIESCPSMDWYDPLTSGKGHGDYKDRLTEIKKDLDNGDSSEFKVLREIVNEKIIPDDITAISNCDFLVAYIKKGIRVWGTICEIFYMKCILKKEVFLITELSFSEMNNWELGLCDGIFTSVDEFIEFVNSDAQEE